MPTPAPAPDPPGEVLQELRRLREVVAAQSLELSALRQLPAPPVPATPAHDVTDELAKIQKSLSSVQSTLDEQGVFDSERMRVLRHAFSEATPRSAGLTQWLSVLFKREFTFLITPAWQGLIVPNDVRLRFLRDGRAP